MASKHEPLPSTPDKSLPNFLLDDIVQLEIGDESKIIKVHKGVLSFYSGYFRAALNGNFLEASQSGIKLPTEESNVVELAVAWMYVRRLNVDFEHTKRADTGLLLCKLWAFADRRQIPSLANVAIDYLRSHVLTLWYRPTHKMIQYAYANTSANAALRRFLVFFIAVTCNRSSFNDQVERSGWPQEAVWDLLLAVWQETGAGAHPQNPNTKNTDTKKVIQDVVMCEYHVHESGVSCKTAGKKRSRSDFEG
ncbi:hypothetical protein KC343_g14054 [Hortaea werneckii]|nr:hypothetical protein KC352_g24989 [Hortaea werneckii]KAI7551783.1 hypothetical protein KC317_g13920 [Hortaea werneckii]KAI7599542.1 hypothetical protein KC346_g13677 [Hortaea werneckii]KAI7604542.1 hypothetical protein KC343_g14054 [Hortaea werneckii]KAI7641406.1 hypothetical protein KC319_g13511 [Hortaea werneckii]